MRAADSSAERICPASGPLSPTTATRCTENQRRLAKPQPCAAEHQQSGDDRDQGDHGPGARAVGCARALRAERRGGAPDSRTAPLEGCQPVNQSLGDHRRFLKLSPRRRRSRPPWGPLPEGFDPDPATPTQGRPSPSGAAVRGRCRKSRFVSAPDGRAAQRIDVARAHHQAQITSAKRRTEEPARVAERTAMLRPCAHGRRRPRGCRTQPPIDAWEVLGAARGPDTHRAPPRCRRPPAPRPNSAASERVRRTDASWKTATSRRRLKRPRGSDHGSDLGRMVGVVVVDRGARGRLLRAAQSVA